MTPDVVALARLLREQGDPTGRAPVDVDAIAERMGVVVAEAPLDGFLGLFIPPPRGPGILLRQGQLPAQRRFTLAHELGHFSLPGHSSQPAGCLPDGTPDGVRPEAEREADRFAAELLMPRPLFRREIRDRDPTFELVKELAAEDLFFVSATAAAIRLVELTAEPSALVCATGGQVSWWKKSPALREFLDIQTRMPVPAESVTSSVHGGEQENHGAEEVAWNAWLGGEPAGRKLLESTFRIPALDQVFSLLHVVG